MKFDKFIFYITKISQKLTNEINIDYYVNFFHEFLEVIFYVIVKTLIFKILVNSLATITT